MDPINYALDVQSPFAAALQGYQAGAMVRDDQQAQALKAQQLQAMQTMQRDIGATLQNPNASPGDFAALALKYPQLKDQFKQANDMLTDSQKQAFLGHAAQVYAALDSGQPGIAKQLLQARAQALENSGKTQDAAAANVMAQVVDVNPDLARNMIALKGSALDPKFAESLNTLAQANKTKALTPAEVQKAGADARKAGAEATTAEVTAAAAPATVTLRNEQTAQEIRASQIKGQIDTLTAKIAAANSETERGRLTLERDKLNVEMQKLGQQQSQVAQDSQNATTQALQTLGDITNHPAMKGWNRPGEWTGAMLKWMPATQRNDLEHYVDALKGQLGFEALLRLKTASPVGASGLGALSEGELKMLSGLAGALDTNSPNFAKQLADVQRYLQKAQATNVARGQLPAAGEAFVMQHPKFGAVTEGTINALMAQRPGMTRDQVLQFLQQTGGK